jgi:hypothetical protein
MVPARRGQKLSRTGAEVAVKKGDREGARHLYRLSAQAEERALEALDPSKTHTLGITVVSATSLWCKAEELLQVERVACHWIASGLLPAFATAQLQELLQTIWHERDLRQSGIELVPGQVTIALAGGEVSLGAAPLRLVHHKANMDRSLS